MKVVCPYCRRIMFECETEEEYYEKLKGQKWIECPLLQGTFKSRIEKMIKWQRRLQKRILMKTH